MSALAGSSFDDHIEQLNQLAYRAAYRLLGDRMEAQDIAQETLARAYVRWRRIHAYADRWVIRVASNQALGVLRRRRRSLRDDEPSTDPLHDDRMALADAIRMLPRRQREVVVLRYLADWSEAEVAERLGISPGSVKQHASRALSSLRVQLCHEGGH
jgi:RNA polymerase sigma-70 factor (sigma-E family)